MRTKKAKASRLAFLLMCLVTGLVLFPALSGRAADGRDFLGTYKVTDATDLGGSYRVTLKLRFFNYSDSDVINATVTLQDSLRPGTDFGSFADTVSIASKDEVRLSGDFTISREEYMSWSNGGAPSFRIEFSDGSQGQVRRTIEVTEAVAGVE